MWTGKRSRRAAARLLRLPVRVYYAARLASALPGSYSAIRMACAGKMATGSETSAVAAHQGVGYGGEDNAENRAEPTGWRGDVAPTAGDTTPAALAPDLRAWFEAEGLMRYTVVGDEAGAVSELTRAPMVACGPSDDDFVVAPHPDLTAYPGKPLREMTLDDYNVFLFRWLEAAVLAGDMRCARCGKRILAGDDLPDPDTWDAIFVEKELVAWMLVHFDCKRWLAKKLKGMTPFDLTPHAPNTYDLSHLTLAETQRAAPDETADDMEIVDTPDTPTDSEERLAPYDG